MAQNKLKYTKILLSALLICLLAATVIVQVKVKSIKRPIYTSGIAKGQVIPAFRAKALDGTTVDALQMRGRSSLVLYFATFNERDSLKNLEKLHRLSNLVQKARIPFYIVFIYGSDDKSSKPTELRSVYPVIPDENGKLARKFDIALIPAGKNLPVTAIPTLMLIDPDGVVRLNLVGEISAEDTELARILLSSNR